MEVWKPIKGWEGYEVSNLGNVISYKRKTPRLLTRMFGYKDGGGPHYKVWDTEMKRERKLFISTLMKEHFPYEWIKNLDDDEEVRPIRGFPGYYITNKGRVWTMTQQRWLSISKDKSPNTSSYYWDVGLVGPDGKVKVKNVHQLVGRSFLPWEEGLCVLHKEEDLPFPEINFLSNLWLGTYDDNNKDKVRKGRARGGTTGPKKRPPCEVQEDQEDPSE